MKLDPKSINTLVVKLGTNLLSGKRAFDGQVMEELVKEMCRLKKAYDFNLLVVSSGAVGCGMNTLGLTQRPADLPHKQAVAAVGQASLVHAYQTLFRTYGDGLCAAQVLLSLGDLDDRQSYLNVRNTLHTLFEMRTVIPILNENDSTAVEELRFSDNDTLAAKIAAKLNASLLIILTDVDGLYDGNPQQDKNARLIDHVEVITPAMLDQAGGAGTATGTGGMRTKLEAAKIACAAGVPVAIANGHYPNVLHGVFDGSVPRTTFAPARTALSHRKRWIAFGRAIQGTVYVDEGARNALIHHGKSLLAAGIVDVDGDFDGGDAVEIATPDGEVIARGLVNYSSRDLARIKGCKSSEIDAVLGYKDFDEAIHRDNMVLL